MQHHWKTLLSESHAKALKVAVLSPLVTVRLRRQVAQAINDGLTLENFIYLTEREKKNG